MMILLYSLVIEENEWLKFAQSEDLIPLAILIGPKMSMWSDPLITIFHSSSNDTTNLLCWYWHLFSFVQLFPWYKYLVWNCWVMCMYILDISTFCEVALQKGWPKFTLSQQYVRVGSAQLTAAGVVNLYMCALLESEDSCWNLFPSQALFLSHVPTCLFLKLPTPDLASKFLAWSCIHWSSILASLYKTGKWVFISHTPFSF